MRKVLFLLMMCFCLCSQAQKVHKVNELKVMATGTIRFVESDGSYSILLRTGNRYQPYMTVALGDSANAVRLLTYLSELKVKGNDIVELENETNNIIKRGVFGSFLVFNDTRVFNGNMHRTHAKEMLEVLTGAK